MSGWAENGHVLAVLLAEPLLVGLDGRRVFAVGGDQRRALGEDQLQRPRIVHQHVAGGRAHEDLHAAAVAGLQRADLVQVVVGPAEVEGVVGLRPAAGEPVLVHQHGPARHVGDGVGHVHEAGDAAGHRGGRLAWPGRPCGSGPARGNAPGRR